MLGKVGQKSSLFAAVQTYPLWRSTPFLEKARSILTRNWVPDPDELNRIAVNTFRREVFGDDEDLGPGMLSLARWHQSREWAFMHLTESDIKRADALDVFTGLTRLRLSHVTSRPTLRLHLAIHAPEILVVAIPMLVKMPIVSFSLFVDIHSHFAFESIRRAKHSCADELISYLYEILFLQQKIAISLHEFLRLAFFSARKKDTALLLNAEVSAVMGADLTFSYLKASIEKTMVLVALAHDLKNLDSRKEHKDKVKSLIAAIPEASRATPYGQFFLEYTKSENLSELNSYRSGLLHKRGIADMQPHNYVGVPVTGAPFQKLYALLHEQHAKNSALLICALALLADRLVELDPPECSMSDFHKKIGDHASEFLDSVYSYIRMKHTEPAD